MKISDSTNVQMPMKTVASLVTLVAVGTWAYFGLIQRITELETAKQLMEADLLKKADQTPKNLEIFMLIEELFKQTDKQQEALDKNIHTQIKLDHLEEQLSKALKDIETLKDKVRQNGNSYSSNNVPG